jgi:hypothetical protein
LADALDSKSSGRKAVWVRAPPPAGFHSMLHLHGIIESFSQIAGRKRKEAELSGFQGLRWRKIAGGLQNI